MRSIWMFGDSFLAPLNNKWQEYENQFKYIAREKEEGNDYIGDYGYWLPLCLKENSIDIERIYNKAKGGYSNEAILNSIDTSFEKIKEGDIVIISSTIITRVLTLDLKRTGTMNINFYKDSPGNDPEFVSKTCFFDLDYVEKKGVEQSFKPFWYRLQNKINFYLQAIKLKKALPVYLALDRTLKDYSYLPKLYGINDDYYIPINKKFPEIDDLHPTYESNKKMCDEIARFVRLKYFSKLL